MKDMIVLCAVLPLFLAMIFFVGYKEQNARVENEVRETVYVAVQEAKLEGCFTSALTEGLAQDLADIAQVDEDEIEIVADAVPKYRVSSYDTRGMIDYQVTVPIKKVVPMPKLFGISDAENQGKIQITGQVASERLAP